MEIRNSKILAIDDDKIQRILINKFFSKYFNRIIVVESAIEALDIIKSEKIDLIITDLDMPFITGMSFIEKIRNENFTIPIIVLTSHTTSEYILPIINLNIQAYIEKPLTEKKIDYMIEKINLYFDTVLKLSKEDSVEEIYLCENVVYDKINLKIKNNEKISNLNNKEILFLNLLLENKNRLVSYSSIDLNVWQKDNTLMTIDALKNVVKSLRGKISKESIENVSSMGYRIIIKEEI